MNNLFYYTGLVFWSLIALFITLIFVYIVINFTCVCYKLLKCPWPLVSKEHPIKGRIAWLVMAWDITIRGGNTVRIQNKENGRYYYIIGGD